MTTIVTSWRKECRRGTFNTATSLSGQPELLRRRHSFGQSGPGAADVRQFEEAISGHQDAAAICRETGDRHGVGQTLNNLGNA